MNIVLIGYTGKTSVAQVLAGELGREFVDSDRLVEEKAGICIDAIVDSMGWDHFRRLEKESIGEISGKDNQIVSTGGGVVLNRENVDRLRQNGLIVWLKGRADVLRDRMKQDLNSGKIRPPLSANDPLEEIGLLLEQRNDLYENAADFIVDTSELSIREVADSVALAFRRTDMS